MPRATASAAAQTSRRILDVAVELFAERGFAEVSVDDVAAAAAVTRGAVYHHYASKLGLFRAVAEHVQAGVADEVARAADAAGDDARAQLVAGSHAFVDAITRDAAARILLVEAPAAIGWEQWRALDAAASERHLREALAAAGVPDDLVDAATAQLSGAMNEAALWLARSTDAHASERAHRVLDALLAAVPTV